MNPELSVVEKTEWWIDERIAKSSSSQQQQQQQQQAKKKENKNETNQSTSHTIHTLIYIRTKAENSAMLFYLR